MQLSIRLRKRRAPRGHVVHDERALVHVGEKATAGRAVREHPTDCEEQRHDEQRTGMVEHVAQQVSVANGESVEPHSGSARDGTHVIGSGHVLLAKELRTEKRDDTEREYQGNHDAGRQRE